MIIVWRSLASVLAVSRMTAAFVAATAAALAAAAAEPRAGPRSNLEASGYRLPSAALSGPQVRSGCVASEAESSSDEHCLAVTCQCAGCLNSRGWCVVRDERSQVSAEAACNGRSR
jgi:hypothetical protein